MAEITYKCTIMVDGGTSHGSKIFNQIRGHVAASNIIEAAKKLVEEYSIKEVRLHAAIVEHPPDYEVVTYLSPEAAKHRDIIVAIDGNRIVNGIITGEHDTPLELLIDGEWIAYLQRKELNEVAA